MARDRHYRQVSTELLARARELRREGTPAEVLLWEHLRERRLDNLKFRRQHAVGRFVLDFYCASARLGIELDGQVHAAQKERDDVRTESLLSLGIRVLRFSNDEVMANAAGVLDAIRAAASPVT